jgi:hypothetical protein
MIFHWLFCIKYQYFLSSCGVWLEVVSEFEQRAIYFGSLRAKTHFSSLGMPK